MKRKFRLGLRLWVLFEKEIYFYGVTIELCNSLVMYKILIIYHPNHDSYNLIIKRLFSKISFDQNSNILHLNITFYIENLC